MKKFVSRLLLMSIPFLILIGLFFLLDPFRILKSYPDYSENMFVIPNRDFVSTEMYLKNSKKYSYNAFIFGSSRTVAFKTASWKTYLPKQANPFVFDASGESIFGIYTKIKYLDRTGARLDHCLLIVCPDCTFAKESDHTDHLGIKHPTVAGTSWLKFYAVFMRAFFDNKFMLSYFRFLLTKDYSPSMQRYIEHRKITYNTRTNDICIVDQEKELHENPEGYYKKRQAVFYERMPKPTTPNRQITQKQREMLREIKQIFLKQHTNYKVVISPLYSQLSFNKADLAVLKVTFGEDAVFDFSGKNNITEHKENYYEASHYRPFVGDSILKILYTQSRK